MDELLKKLCELDNCTWAKYHFHGCGIFVWCFPNSTDNHKADKDMIADAILQRIIQDAIKERGLVWEFSNENMDGDQPIASIYKVGPGYAGDFYEDHTWELLEEYMGDTPTEALLRAYVNLLEEYNGICIYEGRA